MGAIAIAAAVLLGYVGMTALNRSSGNYDVLNSINQVNLYQYENRSLDTSYLHFPDNAYLEDIIKNLGEMQRLAEASQNEGAGEVKKQLSSVEDTVAACKGNYEEILALSTERGFTEDAGLYASFLENDSSMSESFIKIRDDKSWVDGKWIELEGRVTKVKVQGKTYYKFIYTNEIPKLGKRENFLARLGKDAIEYSGDIHINNITLIKGEKHTKIDISALDEEALSGSYGDALKELAVDSFHGKDSISVKTKYTAANNVWEEVTVKMPVSDYNIQDYDSVSYDLYLSPGKFQKLTAACAFSDKYDLAASLEKADADFATYSGHVTEGKDVEQEREEIAGLFDEIMVNIDAYASDEGQRSELSAAMQDKISAYQKMGEADNTILGLKKENIELSENLTALTDEVRSFIDDDTVQSKRRLFITILIVLIASALVIFADTYYISRSMNRSVGRFKETLTGMMEGDLTVRAAENTHDEFSVFGKYVNEFLVKMSGVIKTIQDISETLKMSGDRLDGMAKASSTASTEIGSAVGDISEGASSQAGEVDVATGEITDMGASFKSIVDNVEKLAHISDEMRDVSKQSSGFMGELSNANTKTSEAFSQVVKQIYTTNESAKKIEEATELITSIAEETNLLSLNASIEAARAGEAGRGFAVVASEIAKLATQSASSADKIRGIIEDLVNDTEKTVDIVNEVSQIMDSQQEKLNQTKERFEMLERGIGSSYDETEQIKTRTIVCERAKEKMEGVILNLSAISEENVAATEQTTASMTGLNQTILELVDTSTELNRLAEELDSNLRFFSI